MEERIKAVIYARVSSEEQKKEGFSIPAQLDLLRAFALKNNIEVVKEFEEAEASRIRHRIDKITNEYYDDLVDAKFYNDKRLQWNKDLDDVMIKL